MSSGGCGGSSDWWARLVAGKPARVRVALPAAGVARAAARPRRASLVPRGFAWAVKMSQGTAVFGLQLQSLLAEPEVAGLLRGAPGAGAILAPLCRMLGLPVPELLLTEDQIARASVRAEQDSLRVRRATRCSEFQVADKWPGVKAWRAKYEAIVAAARAPPKPRDRRKTNALSIWSVPQRQWPP